MKIISWNVNGIRSATKKGFLPWLKETQPEILGLQEVRALPSQIDEDVLKPDPWQSHFFSAQRPGYSGVGLYSKYPIEQVNTFLGVSEFDNEGRVQIAHIGALVVANVYFPNGNGKDYDNSRIPFKLDFYRRLFDELEQYNNAGRPLLVMGDFNTAHQEIESAHPKENVNTSGFRIEDRRAWQMA